MPDSPSLGLPLLVAEQAQKHITHNEALRALDAIVQLAVLDRDLAAPPGSPDGGDRYLVAASATGEWDDHDGAIAAWQDGTWDFYTPREGWRCWVADEDALLVFDGSGWVDAGSTITELQNLTLLGIGTTADATNPFSAKLNKALWTAKYAADGGDGDLRSTLNKESAADTVSLLFQDNFSGRAEVGLIGDDDLLFKVSADGSTWTEGLRIDKDDGTVTFPHKVLSLPAASGALYESDPTAVSGAGGYKFRLAYAPFPFTNGPVGETAYDNDIWALGINVGDAPSERLDAAKPYLALHLESKYYFTTFGSEFHVAHIDTSDVERRPLSMFIPRDGGSGSQVNFRADTYYFYDWAGNVDIQFSLGALPGNIDLSNSTRIRAAVNAASFLQQQNASGSFIDLLRVDAGNQAKMSTQGLYVVGARAPSTATFPGEFAVFQPTSANSGDIGVSVHAPAVTGSYLPMNFRADASTGSTIQGLNYSANSTANVRLFLEVLSAGGDPVAVFSVNGGSSWGVGADNSDSDKFKISSGGALGSNDRVTIDANTVAFGLPAKLPSYTVAGVPSASTAGAGAMIYVSNESGGAVPAFSDGTNWLRVTDRAVVS